MASTEVKNLCTHVFMCLWHIASAEVKNLCTWSEKDALNENAVDRF